MDEKDKLIEKEFRNWAKTGRMNHSLRSKTAALQIKKYRKRLISSIRPKKGDKIIDLGSGLGNFLFDLETKHPNKLELFGVDITGSLISESRKRAKKFKNIKFFKVGIDKIKFKENTFDYAFSMRSLHHFYRLVTMLKKIRKILKNGGKFTLFDWCRDLKEVEEWERHFKKTKKSHCKFFTSGEIKNLLERTGFKKIGVYKKDNYMIVTAYK